MWSLKGCHFSDVVDSSANNKFLFLFNFFFNVLSLGKEKVSSGALGLKKKLSPAK